MAELTHHQADALKAVDVLGGGILPAKMIGGQPEPTIEHHLMPAQNAWQASARTPDAIRRMIPADNAGPMLHVIDDGSRTGIPVVNEYVPETRSWRRIVITLDYSVQPRLPARQDGEQPVRPSEPAADKILANVKAMRTELRTALANERDLLARCEELETQRDEFRTTENRLSASREQKKNRQVHDLKNGTASDFSECDAEIADLREQIDLKRDDAEAVSSALVHLQRSLEAASKRRVDCERGVTNAVAHWAKYEQAGAVTALKNEMERVGVCLANLAALDSMMEAGGLGHLAQADRHLRELSRPFVGPFALDSRPSWASCHSPSRLPGVAEARERILDRLASAEVE